MPLPTFIRALPGIDIPFGDDEVTSNVIRSDHGLAVFFTFHNAVEIPAHSHGGQWGTVIEGSVTLTVEGHRRTYRPGESYDIPAGAVHSVSVAAGTVALDVFEEPERYRLRG